ncbi:MAG TPA: thioredoxin-like domain-containing protein [Pirellulales bacterium]|jgi:thiol-disulfide isomerase/thioredoxin|nr:thioredoxin-like domain-containing protein [Pirellulales bacterium]
MTSRSSVCSRPARKAGAAVLVVVGLLASMLGCAEDVVPTEALAVEPPAKPKEHDLRDNPFPRRLKAPGFEGGVAWINTAGPLELEQLRGKFVLVDFWTYCCINCMHILPELKKLEHEYPRDLVVIGVHSAKFETEADSQNITEAVLRNEIEHPVVNDARHQIWNRFGVNSWPTLILIDPEGYAIWVRSGESTFESLNTVMKKAVAYYRRKGLLDETPLRFDLAAHHAEQTPLRYPGKILADEASQRLFIADSNHNRIVVAGLDGKLIDVIGSGAIGAHDGDFAAATFHHPQGMALNGDVLYVADTENHLLRKVNLKQKTVKTIAGRGVQAHAPFPGMDNHGHTAAAKHWLGRPLALALNSPWDVLVHGKYLYIAMAGPHQIWRMTLDESEIGPYAGNGREDIVDGPLLPHLPYEEGFASFAQPSGLATDGTWLYVADSEGSSIRAVPFTAGKVRTIIGTSHLPDSRLFTFGDVDGQGDLARLQHALGVAWHEGKLYVADTYNNKIKVIDIGKDTVETVAGTGKPGHDDAAGRSAQFDEPAGISAAAGKLYVADTNNHLIRVVDLRSSDQVSTLPIAGLQPPRPAEPATPPMDDTKYTVVSPMRLAARDGAVTIGVVVELPEGWKINPLAPMQYRAEPGGSKGPIDRAALGKAVKLDRPSQRLEIRLPVTAAAGDDRVRIALNYYYCQDGREGLCKAATAAWEVPLTVAADAPATAEPLVAKPE